MNTGGISPVILQLIHTYREHKGMAAVANEKCMKKFIPFAISISNTHTQFVSCMIGIHASLLQCRNIRHTLNFCKHSQLSHEVYRRMKEKTCFTYSRLNKNCHTFTIHLHKNIQLTLSKRLCFFRALCFRFSVALVYI